MKWGGGGKSLRLKKKRPDMTRILGFFFSLTLQVDSHARLYRRGDIRMRYKSVKPSVTATTVTRWSL